jgi:hypothetical protein
VTPKFAGQSFSRVAAAASGVASIAFQSSANSQTATLTAPSDIIAGDLLVFLDYAAGPSTPTSAVPSGFTSAGDIAQPANGRIILSYKKAAGSEASSSLQGMTSSSYRKCIGVFRPNIPITSVTLAGVATQSTDGDPTSQNIAASGGTPPLIALCGYVSSGVVNPRTFTPAKDGEITVTSNIIYLAYKIYNSSPADISVDMDDEGSGNTLVSCYLAVT